MRTRTHQRPSAALACLAVAVAVLAGACTGGGSPTPSPTGSLLPASPTALPTFDVATFQELMHQLRGKVVVVNIWGSWCGPCISEAPQLATVSKAYQGVVQFVGVDIQDRLNLARDFIRRFGWIYPSVFDPKGAIRDSFGLTGAPHTLFFDAAGDRTYIRSGPVTADVLTQKINEALARSGIVTSTASGSESPSPS